MATSRVLIPVLACLTLSACQTGSKDDAATPQAPATGKAAASVTAAQAPGNILSANGNQTYDCGGQPVNIAGYRNTLHLVGSCPTLNITGHENKVTVDTSTTINVTGHDNTLTWVSGSPHVNNLGRNNTVHQGSAGQAGAPKNPAAPPPAGAIVVSGDGARRVIACDGKAVEVRGDNDQLTVTGTCNAVSISGDTNRVTIVSTPKLAVLGNGNTVTSGGNPQVSDLGSGNHIVKH
jgi:hypothetical protein